jgi:asparagine synthase (glutamine-hydrolysing)
MCGIWSLINLKKSKLLDVVKLFADFMNLKHRGPDNSYFETYANVFIGFHRLAIMEDTFSANQPFIYEDENRTVIFICNGEIYNFRELISSYNLSDEIHNDCMVIPEIYFKNSVKKEWNIFDFVANEVKGEFAFVLFEFDRLKNLKKVIAARDEIGVRPLYYHPVSNSSDVLFFTSELKGGISFPHKLSEFPPGRVFAFSLNEFGDISVQSSTNINSVYLTKTDPLLIEKHHLKLVKESVINSVRRRLAADKPFAFLLSGGVDSSLVAGLSAKILGKPIRTFCCGMNEGTDLKFARMVADHIGSNHTEVFFTPEEGLAAIPDVIRTIESWDTTSIRASVGQYLVCKYIGTQTDCKVLMVGEGPDEICSSYLFNWYAPNGEQLEKCAKEYVKDIHYYDVKRADRCIARWGLEGRVPLLDTEFIRAYWSISGEKRMPVYKEMEKWWLREAFNGANVIPDSVLWRKKEAFSDGVSGEKSWYQIIQEWVEDKVSDAELAGAAEKYPYCTPKTKEAYYYRRVFCEIFGENRQEVIPGYWQPKWDSHGKEITEYIDPSARVLNIYNSLN